jgi:hypothetical protein
MSRFAIRGALSLPALLLVACAGGTVQSTAVGTPSAPQRTAAVQALPTPHVSATPLQFQREAANPDPNFDMGHAVHITARGFQPNVLVSPCCDAITFSNLSGKPVTVVFDVLPVDSGAIPPGGSWTFTPPNAESISYHSKDDPAMTAGMQVNEVEQ